MISTREPAARARALILTVLWAAAVWLTGCDDDPTAPGNEPPDGAVASVSVTPPAASLEIGDTLTLTAVVRSADGDTLVRSVTWTSSDVSRATVTWQGLVTALSSGPVVVTAARDGKAGTASLEVAAPPAPVIEGFQPASVAAGGPELVLTVLGSGFASNARLLWNGDSRPTTWVGAGELRAVLPHEDVDEVGTAEVRVVNPTHGTLSTPRVYAVVPQTNPVVRLDLRPALSVVRVGGPVPLNAVPRNAAGEALSGRRIVYTSSNHLVATVDGSGVARAVGVGEAVITARSEGVEATTSLSVLWDRAFHVLASDGIGLVGLDMRLGTPPSRFWEHGPGSRAIQPSGSPDGRHAVYTIVNQAGTLLAIVDRAQRTYVFVPGVGRADQPAWSPAGDRIAFRKVAGDRTHIYTVRPDGSDLTNLTADLPEVSSAVDPAWSPDGTRIVFGVHSSPGFHGLMVMDVDGTDKRPLTGGAMDQQPSWVGDDVVFTRRDPWTGATDLYRVSVSGTGPFVRLTETGTAHSPAWSPDQRWIAYVEGGDPGVGSLMAMRPFGEDRRPISLVEDGPAGGAIDPVWVVHR